ncbi:MAG: hypothetical protein JO364_18840 [Pseudonocardiales bacterium]|nr:hypothetical protein [Pseudonocardiales bacterium]MBV9032314.1 hypothetical protein [Pseudonocardiales bacterium]
MTSRNSRAVRYRVVEAPGGEPSHPHSGWTIPHGVPELYAYKLQETLEAESLLLGRVTRLTGDVPATVVDPKKGVGGRSQVPLLAGRDRERGAGLARCRGRDDR